MSSEMPDDFRHHPFWTSVLSLLLLGFTVYGTVRGGVWVVNRVDPISRAEDPVFFWLTIAVYYGVCVLLVFNAIAAFSN